LLLETDEGTSVQAHEWLLTAAAIGIPLLIAVAVTLWTLEQARYRPKKRRSASGLNAAPEREGMNGESGTVSDARGS